ncbi:Probable multidrug resistance ABC transporter ATP-binding/permease protein YheI [Listeria grayi]|uniref:Probable multidrug resistance ABC transporter ATP-binding/permease protein YheI n=1 Tax=Listeria grayi TaxID=1641 RepID=A0A378MB19_LISGR|nr:Probable multidrug resistance ABC transporter ATP-binding/permease protein YheI [Listeria grayi]
MSIIFYLSKKEGTGLKIFKELSWFFKERWKHYLLGVSILFMISLLQLIPPQIIGITIDAITQQVITSKNYLIGC